MNSDDPAYFGGYLGQIIQDTFAALGLGAQAAYSLARNSFEASFLDDRNRAGYAARLDAYV